MTNEEKLIERINELETALMQAASQLREWAVASKRGGWSTHQVEPMRKYADHIEKHYWIDRQSVEETDVSYTRTDTIPKPSEIIHKFWDEVSDYCLKYEKSTGGMPDIRNVELRILKEWEDAESK